MHEYLDPERRDDLAADVSERPALEWVPIEEPYDDTERKLVEHIAEIRRRYEAEVKPFVDTLIRSRSLKPLRGYVRVR